MRPFKRLRHSLYLTPSRLLSDGLRRSGMTDDRMSFAAGARRFGSIRPLVCGTLILSGGVALAFGTGAHTAETAVAMSLKQSQQSLAGAWSTSLETVARQPQAGDLPLQLTRQVIRAAGAKLTSGQIVGDESFWLNTHDGPASAPNPISLGAHVTFSLPAGTAGAGTRSYEVIEMIPLSAATSTQPAAAQAATHSDARSQRLILVVCREAGGTAQTIRFLIEADRDAAGADGGTSLSAGRNAL